MQTIELNGKTILVIGATGFIGIYLVESAYFVGRSLISRDYGFKLKVTLREGLRRFAE